VKHTADDSVSSLKHDDGSSWQMGAWGRPFDRS
ncbi:uncharacterized protein METZ01_LOCUS307899, partial [marine metagenome]